MLGCFYLERYTAINKFTKSRGKRGTAKTNACHSKAKYIMSTAIGQ